MPEGFSIREYASRMRSVNILKCWPFDDTTTRKPVNSLLPPVTIKKFTWWLDELENSLPVMAVDVGCSKKKKKRVEEKGGTSLSGIHDVEKSDMDVEEGLRVVKAPKKRSILEIFASAPISVKRLSCGEEKESVDQELDGFSINSKWGLKGKRNENSKEKKKNKKTMLSKQENPKKTRDKFKSKKRKGDREMDVLIPNKGKCVKLNTQTQDIANGNLHPSYNKEREYGICNRVSIHDAKSRLHLLDVDGKIIAHKDHMLMSERLDPALPVRGVLENQAEVFLVSNPTNNILQEPIQLNHRKKQKENKHVTFSEKDNIIELSRKPLLSVECLKVPTLHGSDMDPVATSFCEGDAQWIEEDSTTCETSENEELSDQIQNRNNIGHSTMETSAFHWSSTDTANYLKQHENDELFCGSLTSDQNTLLTIRPYIFKSGLKDAPQIPVHAYRSGFFSTACECCCNTRNIKVMSDPSKSNCGRVVKDLQGSGSRFRPFRFNDDLNSYNEHSVPYLTDMGEMTEKPQVSLQSKGVNSFCHPSNQKFPNLSPKKYMHSLRSLTNGSHRGYICKRKSIYGLTENFLGLPLTSTGELIKLDSAEEDLVQSRTTADPSTCLWMPGAVNSKCLVSHLDCSSWDHRTERDQLSVYPFMDSLKANPLVVPTRLDFSRYQSNEKGNCDLGLTRRHSFQTEKLICNQNYQMQKFPENEKICSTVRLMGKEFMVGGRLGEPRDTLTCSSEMKFTSESMRSLPHFHGPSRTSKSNFLATQNDSVRTHATISPDASFAVIKSRPVFPVAMTNQDEPRMISLELPEPTSTLQDSYPVMISRTNELKNKQNWLHTPKSGFRFPFMHPDLKGQVLSPET